MTDRGTITASNSSTFTCARATGGNTSVSGVVTAKDGNPRGVIVELWSEYDRQLIASTEASASGAYSFPDVAEGRYELRFRHPTRKYRSRVVHVGTTNVRIAPPKSRYYVGEAVAALAVPAGAVCSLSTGALPTGITLNANGSFSGAITAGGYFFAIIKVATADADYYVRWRPHAAAFFFMTGSGGDANSTSRVIGVGDPRSLLTFENPEDSRERTPSFNGTRIFNLLSGEFIVATSGNAWIYASDNGNTFSGTISADINAAAPASYFARNPNTGTLVRSRGSISGSPPASATRYPVASLFSGTVSSSSAASFNQVVWADARFIGLPSNDNRIVVSTDDGATWTFGATLAAATTALGSAGALGVDGATVMFNTTDAGGASATRHIERSTDGGVTWNRVHTYTGTFTTGEYGAAVVGGNGKWVAVTSENKYAYSSNNGATWTQATGAWTNTSSIAFAQQLAYNPILDIFVLVTGAVNGVYYSTDGGATWTQMSTPFTNFTPQGVVSTYPDTSSPGYSPPALTESLLLLDGANGSTTFADETGRAWTGSGNAQISTAQSQFGGASLLLDGSGDWIQTTSNVDAFRFGTSNFTVEGWFRTSASDRTLVDFYTPTTVYTWQLYIDSSGRPQWYTSDGIQAILLATSSASINDGNWHHVAVSRAGNTLRIFVDGTQTASVTDNTDYTAAGVTTLAIGAQVFSRNGSYDYNGYVDCVRISSTARYTANFTPSAVPFVLD